MPQHQPSNTDYIHRLQVQPFECRDSLSQKQSHSYVSTSPKQQRQLSPFFISFGTALIILLHQLLKWESSGVGAKGSNPNTEKIAIQTCHANTQPIKICWIVSSAGSHKGSKALLCSCPAAILDRDPDEEFAMKRGPRFSDSLPRCKFDGPCEKCHSLIVQVSIGADRKCPVEEKNCQSCPRVASVPTNFNFHGPLDVSHPTSVL